MTQQPSRPGIGPWSPRYQHVTFGRSSAVAQPVHPFGPPRAANASAETDGDASNRTERAGLIRTVLAHAGLSASLYRTDTLERRVPACLRVLRSSTVADARLALRNRRELMAPAVSSLLLGVTSLFRDGPVFDHLARVVLPALAGSRPFVRAWSIGCSDGAEVVSLAVLLSELGLRHRSYVLGMDVRSDAIAAARQGAFDDAAMSGVPGALRDKYFMPPATGGGWRVRWDMLPGIGWWTHDALSLTHAGVWDLILCRNMVMYLSPPAAAGVWDFVRRSLRPGGVLVAGRAEEPGRAGILVRSGPCTFTRTKGAS